MRLVSVTNKRNFTLKNPYKSWLTQNIGISNIYIQNIGIGKMLYLSGTIEQS